MRLVFLVSLISLLGCAGGGSAPEPATPFSLADAEWIDLSHTYDKETIFWPTGRPFEHVETSWGETDGGYFYSSFDLIVSEHTGTHLDSPIHFAEGKRSVDQLAIDDLVGAAAVVDVTAKAAADADYLVSPDDVTAFEAAHGPLGEGDIVLFRTDWSTRWPDKKAYMGDDTPGRADNLHFPGIHPDTARLLVERKVKVIGIDTASIDNGPSTDFMTHRILFEAEIPALENLTSLARLPPRGAWLVAMPMKIGGGSGGPCRVAALLLP